MSQEPKTTKKPKAKGKTQVPDLNTKPILNSHFKTTVRSALCALALTVILARTYADSSHQVVVDRTVIDYALNQITIVGTNFGSGTPSVSLQGAPLTVQSFNPTTGTIVAALPAGLSPGSYLLSVTTATGTPSTGAFDTTYGPADPNEGDLGNGNTSEGFQALFSVTTGANNTAIGYQALYSNTTGGFNSASGFDALSNNISGGANTANGDFALHLNTTGDNDTANGVNALLHNTSGGENTANGVNALDSNTTGGSNIANGVNALFSNTTGSVNTANGRDALYSNTTANFNTADGYLTLNLNTTGPSNTAVGVAALEFNTTGPNNTAIGNQALLNNTTGGYNIGVGDFAGSNLTTGDRNIDIGNLGVAGESLTIRIGGAIAPFSAQARTFIAGIRGVTTGNADAIAVVIDSSGQLGTVSSSQRFKKDIKPMDQSSDAVLALKPVTFHYKNDNKDTPQFGLIAEDVAKVNPALVVRDADGQIYTVRYEAVNAMLLNEFLKEHSKVGEQETTITRLESKVAKQELTAAQQQKQIESLTATIHKVSDQIQLSKPTPQVVDNNQQANGLWP